jgi:type III secretory pathway component EscV
MENQGTPNQENVNQNFNQQFGQPLGQQMLPNSTAVLVLGIISIIGCFCYGFVGVVLGIIALVLAGKAGALYQQNPGLYSEVSYKNMKAGKTCAIIGLSLSAVALIFVIIYICILGAAFSMVPWNMVR